MDPLSCEFKDLGGKILGAESFEQNSTDFRTQLTKIKSLNPKAIYLAGNPREMGRAIRQARELGIKRQILSISTLNDSEVFSITKDHNLTGTIITDASFDPNSSDSLAAKFMLDFRAMFGKEPGILANTAYDALMIIAKALREVGENPDELQSFLHSVTDFPGVSGMLSFSDGGDVNRPIRIAKYSEGKFVSLIKNYKWYK